MKRSFINLLTLGLALLPAFVACGDDEDDSDSTAPLGPPSLRIEGFIGADNRVAERADENPIDVCGARFGVVIQQPENWTLRPPGRCGATDQCGYVEVSLDPSENGPAISAESINLTTMLDLSGAPVFIGAGGADGDSSRGGAAGQGGADGDSSQGGAAGQAGAAPPTALVLPGAHRVRVALRNDDGSIFLDQAGEPVADEADVELAFVPCPSSSGSGSGGDGGQPSAGGAGGAAAGAGGSSDGGAGGSSDGGAGQGGAGFGGQTGVSGAGGGT